MKKIKLIFKTTSIVNIVFLELNWNVNYIPILSIKSLAEIFCISNQAHCIKINVSKGKKGTYLWRSYPVAFFRQCDNKIQKMLTEKKKVK